eukprot:8082914-Alexandrium_andersonii.AAC.1
MPRSRFRRAWPASALWWCAGLRLAGKSELRVIVANATCVDVGRQQTTEVQQERSCIWTRTPNLTTCSGGAGGGGLTPLPGLPGYRSRGT